MAITSSGVQKQGLSWSIIHLLDNLGQVLLGVLRQIRSFGEVLSESPTNKLPCVWLYHRTYPPPKGGGLRIPYRGR